MSAFILTLRARRDLFYIWEYIAEVQQSPRAAERVLAKLEAAMHKLAEMPGLGHMRADVDDPRYRVWKVYSYLIVYRPDTDPLQIIRVIHGARDVPKALDSAG
jgi:antitoxin ParD1/3/4/toxin ParE1/3/4